MRRVELPNNKSFKTEDSKETILENMKQPDAMSYIAQNGLYLNDDEFREMLFEPYKVVDEEEEEFNEMCEIHREMDEEAHGKALDEASKYGSRRKPYNKRKKK